ncbi:uncharacterized protein LOC125315897 [Rhodamnia argentea]|uniref:Uncharacterized protein LOC125315897 n=1 Tax=Rhodamnia argentea TaxID=178133 RepID=A0ABM3HN73_9MYRT|nr:uncharacterized protein LOC125315897 [Rhodamnia argentea]
MKEKNGEVPMESKEQVERIKEILPNCTEREIYEALDYCKMNSDDAAERLLSRVETEKNSGVVPMEGKEEVEHIKKMVPHFAEEMICEVLRQCDMDSNLAIQRLLSQETGKDRERLPVERKEQFECTKEMVPHLTEEDRDRVPIEWKEQVELIKEMTPCFTEEMIFKMLEQCYIDSNLTLPGLLSPGSPLNDFSSPPSSAKSSVTSQLHTVSLDKGKEFVQPTDDDNATTSRGNVRALRVKGPWSSHALQAASDPMALGNNVALGSSEFLEYELFPQPTQQCGIQLTLNDLVANADQPSELRRLLRLPFLETPSVPSRSSAAGSRHPRTSALESSSPSEATPSNSWTSCIHPFRDPQDLVLDSPFAPSRQTPILCPERMSENAPRFTPGASIHQSSEILLQGDNLCTYRQNTHPNIQPSYYQPQLPLQYGYMNRGQYMHQNYRYGKTSPQQVVYQGGSSSRASADPSTGSTPD